MAKKAPGTIIRSTPIAAPSGAKAWKVLYHSRSVDGRDIAVSGVVVVPTAAAPKGGRPVVTWAHGTTGLADQCAPSKRPDAATAIPFVKQLVDAGDVVTATDYEGLGTPGVHPYLVGESEGRSVLDAARAARRLGGSGASDRVLVAGHSQGGQAALFAGELASSYAPELDVLGVAAAAPAADVEHILPLAATIDGGAGYLAMGIEGFHAAYPDADPASVLSPAAEAKAQAATTECSDQVMAAFQGVSGSAVLAHDPLSIPALQRLLHENSAGNRPAGAPLLIVQGSADTTIPKVLTDAFDAKACAAGDTVDYRVYEGAGHGSVVVAARDDVVKWLQDRVAGKPAPTTCSSPS
jgi:pimeloyl-ACP methyl ester carboxylesterase